jgi:hypothetical protein
MERTPMARQFDAGVRDALRHASAVVVRNGGTVWDLALADGSVPARARLQAGWFELTAPLPEAVLAEYDDPWGARVNARLHGPARIVRAWQETPCVKADVFIEHDDNPFDRVSAACLDVTRVMAMLTDPIAEFPLSATPDPDLSRDEIERACSEAGWPVAAQEGSRLRVEIPTRAGIYSARIQSAGSGAGRLVVELADLSGHSAVSRQAVSALLLAVSASVRSVSGLMCDGESAPLAMLAAPLESPLDGSALAPVNPEELWRDRFDRALSALAVACALAGRETVALRDLQLASQYLALRDPTRPGQLHTTQVAEVPA